MTGILSNNTKWFKNCPVCESKQFYSCGYKLKIAKKRNTKCKICSFKETLKIGQSGNFIKID